MQNPALTLKLGTIIAINIELPKYIFLNSPEPSVEHHKRTNPPFQAGNMLKEKPLGNDLLSREVALQVPSALACLTTGFGMGPGVPTSHKSPRDVFTSLD
jgi:hypothetical protein